MLKSLVSRALPAAAAAVLFGLTLFAVYANIRPISGADAQSPGEAPIPVWEPGEEKPTTEQLAEVPIPILLPTPAGSSSSSEDEETPIDALDQWAGERLEAASKESPDERSNQPGWVVEGDDALRDAFGSSAARPAAEPTVLPKAEPPPSENVATFPQDPAQLPAGQYLDEAPPWTPPLTAPTETPADAETSLEAPLELPTDAERQPQTPPDSPSDTPTPEQAALGLPTDTQVSSAQPKRAPPDAKTSPRPPTDSPLLAADDEP